MPSRDLVPLAERPFAPEDHAETVEETVWYNPGAEDVVLDLYVGVQKGMQQLRQKLRAEGKQLTWEQRTGKRRYIIRAKGQCIEALKAGNHDARACQDASHPKTSGERAIPSEFDMAIQHHQCMEPECSQRPSACKNRTHRKSIVGGHAPAQLVMKGMQHRPKLSDGLNDIYAAQQAAQKETVEALIRRSEDDQRLSEAQETIRRLNAEISRKEAELKGASGPVREAATSSERAGVSAAESLIANTPDHNKSKSQPNK